MSKSHYSNSRPSFTLNKAVDVFVDDPIHKSLIEDKLKGEFDSNACIVGYQSSGGLGIFALSNYRKNIDIGISVVGIGQWCRRSIFNHLFSHIFDVLRCKRVSVLIHPGNIKSIKLIKTIGFVHECDVRGLELSQYSLLPEDTKYYEFC